MIASAKLTQTVAIGVVTGDQSGSQADDEALRYDLSIEPIVAALRETVTRIAAQMVLVVAGSALGQGREIALGSPEDDPNVSGLVKAIRAPARRVRAHHHLAEAARLIDAAAARYWKSAALYASLQIEAILRPLKAGWWHLQIVASRAGVAPLVDLGHCCGCRRIGGQRIWRSDHD